MDDEEDDVFEPDPHCWRTSFREIKCEDRGTQTPGPALAPNNGMLPCGVAEEPRPLFYGNAGFRLHFPANFELVGDQEERRQESQQQQQQSRMEPPRQQPVARSVEACIGQKLQLIGDQFHREHLQLYHRNQRNQGPLWWRLGAALLSLVFDRGFIAGGRGGAGQRWIPFSSSLWGTGLLMALSNLTRVGFFGERERKQSRSRRGTETTNFSTKAEFFFSFQEDAMILWDSS